MVAPPPAGDVQPDMSSRTPKNAVLGALLLLVLSMCCTVVFLYLRNERKAAVLACNRQLSAIADERKAALEQWLRERKHDAAVLASYPTAVYVMQGNGAGPKPFPLEQGPVKHLEDLYARVLSAQGYAGLFLLDDRGGEVVRTPGSVALPDAVRSRSAEFASGRGDADDVCFLRDGEERAMLVFYRRVSGGNAGNGGTLALLVDPGRWLYPFLLRRWMLSNSQESLLVGRRGRDLIFLSPLRFLKGPPLTTALSIGEDGIATPGRLAARGVETFGAGLDYRSKHVLAVSRTIRGAPWGLVVKIDQAEAMKGFAGKVRWVLTSLGAIFLCLAGVGFGFWRNQKLRYVQAALARDLKYGLIREHARDIVFFLGSGGGIVEANAEAERAYGYAREELLSLNIRDLQVEPDAIDGLCDHANPEDPSGWTAESLHRRKDGTTFPVEESVKAVHAAGGVLVLAIVRDVTERRQTIGRIHRLNHLLRTLSEVNQVIARERDRNTLLSQVCRILVDYGGYRMAWIGRCEVETGTVKPTSWAGTGTEYLEDVDIRCDGSPLGMGPTGTAIQTGECSVCQDMESDPRFVPWREKARRHGYRSSLSVPILFNGAGALNVYSGEIEAFGEDEIKLFLELAGDIGYALEVMVERDAHRKTEDALRQSEAKFSKIFRASPDAVTITRAEDGAYLEVNDGFVALSGYEPEEVLGRSALDIGIWPFPADRQRLVKKLVEKGAVTNLECSFRKKDGEIRTGAMSARLIKVGGDNCILMISRDITEKKRADELIRENEERYRTLFERNLAGVYRSREDGLLLECNDAFARIFGYVSRKEALGHSAVELHRSPESRAVFLAGLKEKGVLTNYEFQGRRKDGSLIWMLTNASLIHDENPGHFLIEGTIVDITERKKSEEDLLLLFTAIEQGHEAVYITDLGGRILYVNPSLEALTGYDRDELLGQTPRIFKSGAHEPVLYEKLWQTILDGRVWSGVITNRKRDGSLYVAQMVISPVRDSEKEIGAFVATQRDITIQVDMEKRLERARTLETIGMIAGGMAHEVRNPLFALSTVSSALKKKLADRPDVQEFVWHIQDQVRRLGDLMNDLLTLGRPIDAGAFAPCAIPEILEESIRLVKVGPDYGPVRFDLSVSDANLQIRGIRERLLQVFVNLLQNAAHFSPPGDVVQVLAENDGKHTCITVADRGPGIPEDLMPTLFQPFASRRKGGTGLGLAIVRKILSAHGATVKADNRPDGGASFTVCFVCSARVDQ